MSNRNEGRDTKRYFKIELYPKHGNYWLFFFFNERELREVLSTVPSFLPPSHQVLCGKAMAVLWEEALGLWKEMKSGQVQGKQGTERRKMMAAEADLDPKSMLRSLRRFLVISPHATVRTWRTGVHLPLPSPYRHTWTVLALHLHALQLQSLRCWVRWWGRASET